jgi:hypothetical protein
MTGRPNSVAHRTTISRRCESAINGYRSSATLAWRRRPDNHTGALMVGVGLAYALPGLRLVHTPLGFTLYLLVATLPSAVLAHLLAVFPDGRATSRLQRVFIVANYATTVPLAFIQLLLVDPQRLR